jgi:hypothetical protein
LKIGLIRGSVKSLSRLTLRINIDLDVHEFERRNISEHRLT